MFSSESRQNACEIIVRCNLPWNSHTGHSLQKICPFTLRQLLDHFHVRSHGVYEPVHIKNVAKIAANHMNTTFSWRIQNSKYCPKNTREYVKFKTRTKFKMRLPAVLPIRSMIKLRNYHCCVQEPGNNNGISDLQHQQQGSINEPRNHEHKTRDHIGSLLTPVLC